MFVPTINVFFNYYKSIDRPCLKTEHLSITFLFNYKILERSTPCGGLQPLAKQEGPSGQNVILADGRTDGQANRQTDNRYIYIYIMGN